MKTIISASHLPLTKTPEEVFKALTNVRGWWSKEIQGGTAKLNDEFLYSYQDAHRCKVKLIEVVPDKKNSVAYTRQLF